MKRSDWGLINQEGITDTAKISWAFPPRGQLDYESPVTAQNDVIKTDTSSSRSLNFKT